MYAITGITGKVGGALARSLLAERLSVRAVLRDEEFNITCCSCTRSHWMLGKSPVSCVPTVTPVLTASLRVRVVTSRTTALRSTTSFRGGAFLMRDPIRSTTTLPRSVLSTMQVRGSGLSTMQVRGRLKQLLNDHS